jgi:hypothetical protein
MQHTGLSVGNLLSLASSGLLAGFSRRPAAEPTRVPTPKRRIGAPGSQTATRVFLAANRPADQSFPIETAAG